jgi:hypothetical protein
LLPPIAWVEDSPEAARSQATWKQPIVSEVLVVKRFFGVLLGLSLLVGGVSSWAQTNPTNPVENPLDFDAGMHKGPTSPPPKPPKPFMEKDGIRYYALGQFVQDETNTKKAWRDHDGQGHSLEVAGTPMERGICYQQKKGVENLLQWHLDGRYAQLETTVGIPKTTSGEITIYVYGDDKRLYRTETLTASNPSEKISVPIDGVEHLSIRSHASNTAAGSLIVIGDPIVTREPGM